MTFFFCLVFILTILGLIAGALARNARRKAMTATIHNTPDFTPTQLMVSRKGSAGLAYDEQGKTLLLVVAGAQISKRVISYRDLMSVELFEDGNTITKTSRSSQIGGAIIGGLALGGVGMLMGGLSGKTKSTNTVTRLDLRLIVNDTNQPLHDVTFLETECAKDSPSYSQAIKSARHWHGLLEVLIKRADAEDKKAAAPQAAQAQHTSLAEELQRLAALRDSKVLTEAEFQAQKKRLLGEQGEPAPAQKPQAPMDPDTLVQRAIKASQSPTKRPEAIRALKFVIQKYPGSASAKRAQSHLAAIERAA